MKIVRYLFVQVIFLITLTVCIYIFKFGREFQDYKYQIPIPKSILRHALDPKSAFFGMKFKNSYGLPLSYYSEKSPVTVPKSDDWKNYFPGLVSSLRLYDHHNKEKNISGFTFGALVTMYTEKYKVGDTIVAKMHAIDKLGRRKLFGGDYFRARITYKGSSSNYPDGIACDVIDHANGTYTLLATLPFPGAVTLDITLVYSAEVISDMIDQMSTLKSWESIFTATLKSKEVVECNVNLSHFERHAGKAVCDYSNPRNGEPWFCVNLSGRVCSPIVSMTYIKLSNQQPNIRRDLNMEKVCTENCRKEILPKRQVIITTPIEAISKDIQSHLPSCQTLFSRNEDQTRVSGFFKSGHWNSLICKNHLKSFSNLNECLKNKRIYFFGDSTIRQFFYLVSENAHLTITGPLNDAVWLRLKIAYSDKYNTTLYYRAHGPPLQNLGAPYSRPYISDSIDGIEVGGRNVYVILNVGAHLVFFEPELLIHRLKGIRKSIINHRKKFPDTRFIVRGSNVVSSKYEWLYHVQDFFLRHIFKGIENLTFIDLWGLTSTWPQPRVHPDDKTLMQEALLMFSYICD